MHCKYSILLGVALMTYHILQITARVEFTNLKCVSLDKTFSDFEYCQIKAVNRSYKYFELKIQLFKVPVSNVTVNVALMKRLNGYKPFLYNVTFDACKFIKSTNKNPVINYFYGFLSKHSNINHTCPFNNDLLVDKVSIEFVNYQVVKVLPFPEGDYAVFTNWYAYDINRADVRLYLTLA
ncbi:uncharacterized protein LOC111518784 [Drosophila willistoni]|uniref:uncharacterized protein LOC111518784 n=1 Tax=Drosophila willistoni TaxID=7260 RepID=UPI001F0869DA|nr:uncharacterized protein LOC111518784 [Drosophila willistoni]XP_046867002.1 uncharacterized protein LOC111518784 [Drosophila willistoni]